MNTHKDAASGYPEAHVLHLTEGTEMSILHRRGLDMSVVGESTHQPLSSNDWMLIRNTLAVAASLTIIITGLITLGVLNIRWQDQKAVQQSQIDKVEYQKALQACDKAAPAAVGTCIANVNVNFSTGG